MDLEAELRAAMAAHVSDVDAPAELAAAVRARHRRRTARIRATVATAVVMAAGMAGWPAYHAVHATPAGSGHPLLTASPSAGPVPSGRSHGATSMPVPPGRPRTSPRSSSAVPSHSTGPTRPGVSWVTYIPGRLKPAGACHSTRVTGFPATICEWTGASDWLKIQVVRSPALLRAEQLGLGALTSRPTTVHGQPALATPGHLAWIERPGVGILVSSDLPLDPQLPKIADGIHP